VFRECRIDRLIAAKLSEFAIQQAVRILLDRSRHPYCVKRGMAFGVTCWHRSPSIVSPEQRIGFERGCYYTRSRRQNCRVAREYISGGLAGKVAAILDALERDRRELAADKRWAVRAELDELAGMMTALNQQCDLFTRAADVIRLESKWRERLHSPPTVWRKRQLTRFAILHLRQRSRWKLPSVRTALSD
jgi:hypothetical protein